MKIGILIIIAVLLISACNNAPEKEETGTVARETEKSVSTIEAQVKNSLLAKLYQREVLTIKDDELNFMFKFDLNSDAGQVPDTYGAHLSFSFKVAETLRFPEKVAFVEEGFSEEVSASLERYEGVFNLVATTEDLLIYKALEPQRTLVLFKDGVQTGTLAYYFNGVENPEINATNVYEVIENAYEEGEMFLEHSRSSMLSTLE